MDEKKIRLQEQNRKRQLMISLLPFAALILLFVILCIVIQIKGYRLPMYLKIIFNEGVVLAIVATGATFIYTLGSFDISLGASTLFAAAMAAEGQGLAFTYYS